jgi:hypothetical protein
VLAFCQANQECKKILIEQNDIYWNLQKIIFWENKIDYNKIIMFTQNNLIIITGNAKQHRAQICVEAIQILWFTVNNNNSTMTNW